MLELKNVSFEVSDEKAQKEIIRGINLKIDDNKFVVITGPNGGGKSTLAKLIVGIEKPTSGQILFNGEDITEKSITERAKMGISFAFQQPVRFKGIQVRRFKISALFSRLVIRPDTPAPENVILDVEQHSIGRFGFPAFSHSPRISRI